MQAGLQQLQARVSPPAGLPEEMRVVRTAVRMDYAAVAFSSADKQSRCWDAQALDRSVDIPAVGTCSFPLQCRVL